MDGDIFVDPFERLLRDLCPLSCVRAAERGHGVSEFWAGIAESGFLDVLVPEQAAGAGLCLRDAVPLVEALGRHLVAAPVADTMMVRALLARNELMVPTGPIVLATQVDGQVALIPSWRTADYALVDSGTTLDLHGLDRELSTPDFGWGGFAGRFPLGRPLASMARPADGLRPLSAVLRVAEMAGAAGRLLDMTVTYANERAQFGKPIGKQQAIQQQLAVMAEKTVMTRMAARLGCACDFFPDLAAAATAKSVASSAATEIASIAHAVHGAIGISEEHDLQLFTRRLHAWRLMDGSESHWSRVLGKARLASGAATSAEFVRSINCAT